MTTYSPQELADGWEFKILRSVGGAFRNTEKLKEVLAEEGRAGWMLVEKFDNGRIRLKRPSSARDFDGKLDFDPYRTCHGPSANKYALVILGIALGSFAAMLGVIAVITNMNNYESKPVMPPTVETVAPLEKTQPKE